MTTPHSTPRAPTPTEPSAPSPAPADVGDVAHLRSLLEPGLDAPTFLSRMLAAQCRILGARIGAVFRPAGDDTLDLIAVHPSLTTSDDPAQRDAVDRTLQHAGRLAHRALSTRDIAADASHASALGPMLATPMPTAAAWVAGVFIFPPIGDDAGSADAGSLERARRRTLAAVAPWTGLHTPAAAAAAAPSRDLASVVETAAAALGRPRFAEAAQDLVHELAARFRAERVSVGGARPAGVRLDAISNAEKIDRASPVVRALEAVMDEANDQQRTVRVPAAPASAGAVVDVIDRDARRFAREHRPSALIAVPLPATPDRPPDTIAGGAIVLERAPDEPFTDRDALALQLTADLVGPWLATLRHRDRWIGARLATRARRTVAWALGPRQTWAKLAAIVALALVLIAVFVRIDLTAGGSFVVVAEGRRVIAAPFAGELAAVYAQSGDAIERGDPLLALATADLRLERAAAEASVASARTEAAAARDEGRIADARIAEARAAEARARADLLAQRIDAATVVAPTSGVVIAQDLRSLVGARLDEGRPLAEILPSDGRRVDVLVPESDIGLVEEGGIGAIAPAAMPERRVPIRVQRIAPAAEVINGRNVFRVRATLDDAPDWLRPGAEGVARIDVGRAPIGVVVTRDFVRWLRLNVWW